MIIEAVIFDMDGLMLDTEPLYQRAWQTAGMDLGYEIDDLFYATLIGRPTVDCEAALMGKFGEEFPLEEFQRRWPILWKDEANKGISRKPGLLEMLDFTSSENILVAVATSSDAEFTAYSLESSGLTGRMQIVVTGDTVAAGKPAPDIYLAAARKLNIPPHKCFALEDSEAGIVAAKTAGMITVLIPDVIAPTEVAIGAADYVVESLHDARAVIKNARNTG